MARRVSALGVAQIISWGTLFYTIAVLGGAMRRELGISDIFLFGSFTAGLFLSGIVSPLVGREIDMRGGRRVLAGGSLLGAIASVALATAQGPLTMLTGWLLAGVAMCACLYDPAFATLHQFSGTSYRRAVTALTLFGGFASTVFWPLSQYLLDAIGWRQTFAVYAGLHLLSACRCICFWFRGCLRRTPRPGQTCTRRTVRAGARARPSRGLRPRWPSRRSWARQSPRI